MLATNSERYRSSLLSSVMSCKTQTTPDCSSIWPARAIKVPSKGTIVSNSFSIGLAAVFASRTRSAISLLRIASRTVFPRISGSVTENIFSIAGLARIILEFLSTAKTPSAIPDKTLDRSNIFDKPVADPAQRLNMFSGFAQLLAQAADVDVDCAGFNCNVNSPDRIKQALAADNFPFVRSQIMQERKFLGGQFNRFSAGLHFVIVDVNFKRPEFKGWRHRFRLDAISF